MKALHADTSGLLARFFPSHVFDGGGRCVWLRRWTLFNRFGYALFLHYWLNDDWTVHHHDHSRAMVSIGLRGAYTEHFVDGTMASWKAPWVRHFPATHRHYVTLDTPTVWTLVLALPQTRKSWFWVNGRQMGREYLSSDYADEQKRC